MERDGILDQLEQQYPYVLHALRSTFTIHDFFRQVAKQQPHLYIELLYACYAAESPFHAAHEALLIRLKKYAQPAHWRKKDRDLFGTVQRAPLWQKR